MRDRIKATGRREKHAFVGIPKACMNHENYIVLTMPAKILLHEFCYQYNGFNNGDLCAAFSVLNKRGWKSKGTVNRALKELKERGWIIVSRQGGKNQCSLYALTFQAIDECKGKLDIKPTVTSFGYWKKLDSLPPISTNVPPMSTNEKEMQKN